MGQNFVKMIFLVLISSTLFTAEGWTQTGPGKDAGDVTPSINVQGMGRVEAVPDQALARFGVVSDEETLSGAYADNISKVNAVIAAVKDLKVDPKDIQTSSFFVTPVYPTNAFGRRVPDKPVSFRVSQQLTVKVRDVSEIETVIVRVIEGGVNEFQGIEFLLSNLDALEKEATVAAARDARDRVKLIAEGLGLKTGKVLRVSEALVQPYPSQRFLGYGAVMGAAPRGAAPRIEVGSMEVKAACNVEFEIIEGD